MRALLLLGALAVLAAADPSAAAAQAREQAAAQLAAARTRIANEQAALLGRLQAAVAMGNAQRARAVEAAAQAAQVAAEVARAEGEQERAAALARQLADRAVVAARLPEAEGRALAMRSPVERIEAAAAGLARRVAALPARLARRQGEEAVVGRDGAVATVPVLRLGEARAVALGGGAHRGLLERSADGAVWLVSGPPLPPLADGAVPLDAAGGAARQAAATHRTLAQWLAAGRAFIWPILAALALGLGLVAARALALHRRRVDPQRLAAVADLLSRGERTAATALVEGGTTPLDRVLRAGLAAAGRPREAREAAVEQALIGESGELTRGLTMIAVLAGVAPLLGLLGTVTGMIDMFSVISAQGAGDARSLSGGISEALVCTQAGMIAAIPLLLAHAVLARAAERRGLLLEEAAVGVLGLGEARA